MQFDKSSMPESNANRSILRDRMFCLITETKVKNINSERIFKKVMTGYFIERSNFVKVDRITWHFFRR